MSYNYGKSQEESREDQPSGDGELVLKAFLQVSQKRLKWKPSIHIIFLRSVDLAC